MKTNLAYIDDVIDRETERRHADAPSAINDNDRSIAKKAATRNVAGFDIFDEAKERKELDDMIASKRKAIDTFRADRTKARERLAKLGVTPLAVVPLSAWEVICDKAGLFRLSPDKEGRVGCAYDAFKNYIIEVTTEKRGMFGNTFEAKSYKPNEVALSAIDEQARRDWNGFLKEMFGGLVAPTGRAATLILPTPPADVADILLKASSGEYLGLKVAAVAEAIGFKESPSDIVRNEAHRREEEARRKEMIDADPIVYHEEGTAAAIIAQFGDFPIEKAVVDAVVASDDLIKERPSVTDSIYYLTGNGVFTISDNVLGNSQLSQLMAQQALSAMSSRSLFTNL